MRGDTIYSENASDKIQIINKLTNTTILAFVKKTFFHDWCHYLLITNFGALCLKRDEEYSQFSYSNFLLLFYSNFFETNKSKIVHFWQNIWIFTLWSFQTLTQALGKFLYPFNVVNAWNVINWEHQPVIILGGFHSTGWTRYSQSLYLEICLCSNV